MSEDVENDDQWLYGDNADINPEQQQIEEEKSPEPQPEESVSEKPPADEPPQDADDGPPGVEDEKGENEEPEDDGEVEQNGDDSDKDLDSDDSDDDVNVVIGDIKTTPSYTSLNIKRGGLISSSTTVDKTKTVQQTGKFTVDEFDQTGTINGVPATEYNLDSLEDKPWRKPGADITDYFNYGFNEDTWRAYCDRQKRMRVNESGVGLAPINPTGMNRTGPVPILNENSKYTGNIIPGTGHRNMSNNPNKVDQPKMNTIQVMTADRREYSRKPAAFPDMSVPPPTSFEDYQPDYGFNPEPEPFYGGYEPTQESQWTVDANPGWAPEVKSLTPNIPVGPPPQMHMAPPPIGITVPPPVSTPSGNSSGMSPRRAESRERDKEREPSRSRSDKSRDRERERSHRRERSRSRSRRHKSRSRSPSHRSHRKKKSRRHDDSD